MDLTHRFTVPTDVESTWSHFQDIGALAECFPGATVTSFDEHAFKGSCKVKLGPIALLYTGSGTFVEKDDTAHRFVVDAKGKDKRGNGTAGATVTLSMSDAGGSTDVEVVTDLAITGKPAQFGRGVMQDVSDKLLGQFVTCLQQRLEAGEEPPSASPPSGEGGPADGAPDVPDQDTGTDQDTGPDQDAGPASEPTGAAAVPAPDGDPDAGPASVPDAAAASGGTAPGAGSAAGAAAAPRATGSWGPVGSAGSDDALDLGSAVWPVLLRSYGKPAAAVLGVLLLLWWWSRRD